MGTKISSTFPRASARQWSGGFSEVNFRSRLSTRCGSVPERRCGHWRNKRDCRGDPEIMPSEDRLQICRLAKSEIDKRTIEALDRECPVGFTHSRKELISIASLA